MRDYYFKNSTKPNLYRMLRLGDEWNETFVLEYISGSDDYLHLYWGNKEYVKEDREVISIMLVLTWLRDSKDEWEMVNLRQMGPDSNTLLSKAERDVKILMNS